MTVSVRHSSARIYKYIGSDDILHIEHNILRRSVTVRRSLVVTGEDFDRAKQMLDRMNSGSCLPSCPKGCR